VYLVYDNSYQVIGVVSGEKQSYTSFGEQAVSVVGPIELGKPVDWANVREDRFGIDFGPVSEYSEMNDGVPPTPEPDFYQGFGIKNH
jgi:hypothetical protein